MYQYQPLEGPRRIRLLLARKNGILYSHSIIHVELDSATPFVAIPYVWGDSKIARTLSVAGQQLGLTESLHTALRDVMESIISGIQSGRGFCKMVDPDAVYVWADAVCINQQNIQEKNTQVPLMTEIYARVSFVATHMGSCDEKVELGIEMLRELLGWYDVRLASGCDTCVPYVYDLVGIGLPARDSSRCAALRSLWEGPWTQRAWIFQEFVVNETAVLVSGQVSMVDWRLFL